MSHSAMSTFIDSRSGLSVTRRYTCDADSSAPRSRSSGISSVVFQRHSHWRDPTEAETAAAVAELREIIGNRPDGPALLAEVAGILIGAREGELDEAKGKAAARLCIAAGADETLIPQWIQQGRRRRAMALLAALLGTVVPAIRRPGRLAGRMTVARTAFLWCLSLLPGQLG